MSFSPKNQREQRLYEKSIKIPDLKDQYYYRGECRNSEWALWDAPSQKFYYIRYKFGDSFKEEIEHPDNDRGYDVFFPLQEFGNVF